MGWLSRRTCDAMACGSGVLRAPLGGGAADGGLRVLRGGGEAGEGEVYTGRAGLDTCLFLMGGSGGSYAFDVLGRNCVTLTAGEGGGGSDTGGAAGGGTDTV